MSFIGRWPEAVGVGECGCVGRSAGGACERGEGTCGRRRRHEEAGEEEAEDAGEAVGARGHAGGRVRWMGCWLLHAIAVSDFAAGAGAWSVGEVAGESAV